VSKRIVWIVTEPVSELSFSICVFISTFADAAETSTKLYPYRRATGANSFHGSAYEFYRGDSLNAYQWNATTKAPYKSNEFGGSFGAHIQEAKNYVSRTWRNDGIMMTRKLICRCWLVCALAVIGSALLPAQDRTESSSLEFHSSNAALNASFAWAKQQALAYTHSGSDSIGAWYEAALPGRNAFCMRDVSHQTQGAAALGLFAANHNMLDRFALSVAPSRNWAGYWEIDSKGQPSTADYLSDDDFWFNLPANFDVLDAIVRMWRWTGDDSYRNDPRLQEFFRKTLTDYMTQWQLQPETILTRPRIANRRLREGKFVDARGIPSYSEGQKDFNLGVDLLAVEYRAIRSYQEIAASPADKQLAEKLQKTANEIQHILETVAWSPEHGHFNGVIQQGSRGYGSADTMVLDFDAVQDEEHLRGALDYVTNPAYWKTINIEEESYTPLTLFRYGRSEAAYQVLLDLSDPAKPRREYPEVSYAVVAGLVSGAMGVEPGHMDADYDLQSLARPQSKHDEQSLTSLPIRGNVLDLVQRGDTMQQLINHKGRAIRWRAEFPDVEQQLMVNGKSVHAENGTLPGGRQISWTIVVVPPDASVTVIR
jgi:hypothetical protein